MEFVQTHWLWTSIDDIEVMVQDGRVYCENMQDLGTVEEQGNNLEEIN